MRNEDARPTALSRSPDAYSPTGTGAPADELLLKRYIDERDETAFAALVQRYGPLVLGVCRRVLAHEQDAEDAFQATFMVLARKARSISRSASTGGWLYRVAYRMAIKLKGQKARRNMHAHELPDLPAPDEHPGWAWREMRVVLDEEINRLPQKYRVPFILCYLDGKTNEQAAQQLACPVGTLASRLAWARKRLQGRLTRRGVSLPAGVLASALASYGLAAVPVTLAEVTTHSAVQFALGKAAAAGSLAAKLAREYLNGALRVKLLKGAVAVLILGLGIAFVAWWFVPGPARPVVVPAPRNDLQQIQGNWQFVNLEFNGRASQPGNTRMIFGDGQCQIVDPGGAVLPMTFQIDPTQEPPTIDLDYVLGRNEKVPGRGIYRLEGDRLTICYCLNRGAASLERSSEFVSHPNRGEMMFTLQRIKADSGPVPDNPTK
jgi:RNA polymerase sigma factor (sigma-70 family)